MSTIAFAVLRLLVLLQPAKSPDVAAPVWTRGLPAVSDDGKWVAVAIVVSDGARANDNLALGIFDVGRDRLAASVVVIDAADPAAAVRAARDARASALLAKRTWRPLQALVVGTDDAAPSRAGRVDDAKHCSEADGDDLLVRYCEPMLSVRDGSSHGRRLLGRAEARFSARGGERCKGCGDCPKPRARLAAVYVDRGARVLLLEIAYLGGSDVCWEPDETFHVVRFRR
jgi:hypothetical protein